MEILLGLIIFINYINEIHHVGFNSILATSAITLQSLQIMLHLGHEGYHKVVLVLFIDIEIFINSC